MSENPENDKVMSWAMKVEPMGFHFPGWRIKRDEKTDYMLWAPRENRPGWAACWTRDGGYTGDFRRGDTAEEALAVFPDDAEAVKARRLLLDAARKAGVR